VTPANAIVSAVSPRSLLAPPAASSVTAPPATSTTTRTISMMPRSSDSVGNRSIVAAPISCAVRYAGRQSATDSAVQGTRSKKERPSAIHGESTRSADASLRRSRPASSKSMPPSAKSARSPSGLAP
jgi:hypothetical protein